MYCSINVFKSTASISLCDELQTYSLHVPGLTPSLACMTSQTDLCLVCFQGQMDSGKMPACPADNALYFVPSCPPQHYDVTGNGSYLPYDTFSVQSPYQLMRWTTLSQALYSGLVIWTQFAVIKVRVVSTSQMNSCPYSASELKSEIIATIFKLRAKFWDLGPRP